MSMREAVRKAKKEKFIYLPGVVLDDGRIVEEIYDGRKPKFLVYTPASSLSVTTVTSVTELGDYEIVDSVQHLDATIRPMNDQLLFKGYIALPTAVEDYTNEGELFKEMLEFAKKYADVNDLDLKLCLITTMTSWVHDKCPVMPILNIRGGSETGKTRLGEILRQLSYRGMRASGTLSLSSLFRNAERWKGTLMVNEADMKASSETAEITKYLNERYEKGGCVWRTNPNTLKPEVFQAYGPTILITRGGFSDDALESRVFIIKTMQTDRKDIPLNLPEAFYNETKILRNKLLCFRLKHYHNFENDFDLKFDGIGLRLNQILQPITSLAKDRIPKLFQEIKACVIELNERIVEERASSLDGMIIRAYVMLWREGVQEIRSVDIREKVEDAFGSKMSTTTIGKRTGSLRFKKLRSGTKRLLSLDDGLMVQYARKYLPKDEREEVLETFCDRCDSYDRTWGRAREGEK